MTSGRRQTPFPLEVLARIVNTEWFYDVSSKPPATIEWE